MKSNSYKESIKKEKKYKCFFCKNTNVIFNKKGNIYSHIKIKHKDILKDFNLNETPISKIYFDSKPYNVGIPHKCTICKINDVKWNSYKEKYERFCSLVCLKKASDLAKKNMVRVYGKEHILNDPQHQQKMLDNRSISKEYHFKDGGIIIANSTLEYKFLKFCEESKLQFKSTDIFKPIDLNIFFVYKIDGEERKYIPDYFIPEFNLIIEIKDGGDHPNLAPQMKEVKDLVEYKDKAVIDSGKFNYIRISDTLYDDFLKMIDEISAKKLSENDDGNFIYYIGV